MAATVDLNDLIDDMKTELAVPGESGFANATDAEWLSQLRNAFWECALDGLISGYQESDGVVSPISGSTALPRDLQQVVIYYAGVRILRNKLVDLKTRFVTEAGPVKYEIEQSAAVLKGILDELIRRRNVWLIRISDVGHTNARYVDMVISRDESMNNRDIYWMR